MKILLLPGADGTGVLFEPLLKQIEASGSDSSNIDIINLNYDKSGQLLDQALAIQAQRIENLYANQSVTIVAESYSGLLAYELLTRQNMNITRVVFVASFLSTPNKIASIASTINTECLESALKFTPDWIWGRVLFGKWQNEYLRALFMDAMNQTPNQLLQQRLNNIAIAKLPTALIDVPCLYLQGKQDNLVAAKNIILFSQLFTNFEYQALEGTHFLLQTNPKEVWQAVSAMFVRNNDNDDDNTGANSGHNLIDNKTCETDVR